MMQIAAAAAAPPTTITQPATMSRMAHQGSRVAGFDSVHTCTTRAEITKSVVRMKTVKIHNNITKITNRLGLQEYIAQSDKISQSTVFYDFE